MYDWVNYIFPNDKFECPESMAHDQGKVYLVPEFDHPSEVIDFLKENYSVIFEEELLGWTTDENIWPEKLTWEMFQSWFQYSIQSMVLDTLDEEIEKDDF